MSTKKTIDQNTSNNQSKMSHEKGLQLADNSNSHQPPEDVNKTDQRHDVGIIGKIENLAKDAVAYFEHPAVVKPTVPVKVIKGNGEDLTHHPKLHNEVVNHEHHNEHKEVTAHEQHVKVLPVYEQDAGDPNVDTAVAMYPLGLVYNGFVTNALPNQYIIFEEELPNIPFSTESQQFESQFFFGSLPPVVSSTTSLLSIDKSDNDGGNSGIDGNGHIIGNTTSGTEIDYTITVENTGVKDATKVVISDILPTDFTLDPTHTTPGYTESTMGGVTTITWSGLPGENSISHGGSFSVSLDGTIASGDQASSISNTATTSANDAPPVSATDIDNLTQSAVLTIVKTDNDTGNSGIDGNGITTPGSHEGNAIAGNVIDYTLTDNNTGPSDATNVVISDVLPTDFTLGTGTTPGFTESTVGGITTVTWSGLAGEADIAPGGSFSVLLDGTIASGDQASSISNTATTSANDAPPVSATDIDNLTQSAVLTIVKTDNDTGNSGIDGNGITTPGSHEGNAIAGNVIDYTLTDNNTGPSDATNVVISDVLPTDFTLGAGTTPGFTESTVGGITTVTWSGLAGEADIAPGGSFSVLLDGTIASGDQASSISNTATTSANDAPPVSATDIDNLTQSAVLTIVKTDNDTGNSGIDGNGITTPGSHEGNAIAGNVIDYTLTDNNTGPSDATNVVISDVLPTDFTLGAGTTPGFTESTVGGITTVTWSGLAGEADIAPGGSFSVLLDGTIASGDKALTLSNTATTSASDAPPVSATDIDKLAQSAVLTIVKTDNDGGNSGIDGNGTTTPGSSEGNAIAGNTIDYTLTIHNTGPSDATNVVISDVLPTDFTLGAGTTAGSTETTVGGVTTVTWTGLAGEADIAPGGSFSVLLDGTIASGDKALTLSNTATTSASDAPPVSATDIDKLAQSAVLTIVKTDNDGGNSGIDGNGTTTPGSSEGNAIAGNTIDYTLTIHNTGPSDATNVVISDVLPTDFTLGAGTTAGSTETTVGGVTTVTWTGLAGEADIAPGGSFSVLLDGTIASGDKASILSNTATTSASDAPPVSATDIDKLAQSAVLTIVKTDNDGGNSGIDGNGTTTPGSSEGNAIAGNTIDYTLTIHNTGLSDATNVVISDVLPTDFTLGAGTTAGSTETTVGGVTTVTWTGLAGEADIAPGGSFSVLLDGTIASGDKASILSNTATTSASDAPPVSATDIDKLAQSAVLTIVKTDNDGGNSGIDGNGTTTPGSSEGNAIAGNTIDYTLTIHNTGPSDATNVVISDVLPTDFTLGAGTTAGSTETTVGGVTTVTWTGLAGEADIAPGGSFSVLLDGTIASGDKASTLSNTATTSASDAPPVSATDIDKLAQSAVLTIVKTDNDGGNSGIDGNGTTTPGSSEGNAIAGNTIDYALTIHNTGPSDATNVVISDVLPTDFTLGAGTTAGSTETTVGGVTTVTWTGLAGEADIAPGGSFSVLLDGTIASGDQASTLSNTATTSASDAPPVSATDIDKLAQSAVLTIVKTDNDGGNSGIDGNGTTTPGSSEGNAIAGNTIDYTLTIHNTGPSDATNVVISDVLPTDFTLGAGTTAGSTETTVGGVTTVTWTGLAGEADIAPGGSFSVLLDGTIASGDKASTLSNTATTSASDAPPVSATDIDKLAQSAVLTIVKTDNDGGNSGIDGNGTTTPGSSEGNAIAGNTIDYTLTIHNTGPSDATNVVISDVLPTDFTLGAGTTAGSTETTVGGVTTVTWTGLAGEADIAPGGSFSVLLDGTIASGDKASTLSNTATTSASDAPPVSATDIDKLAQSAVLTIVKTDNDGGNSGIDGNGTTTPGSSEGNAIAGNTIDYALTIHNTGPSDATNVVISDVLPTDFTLGAGTTAGSTETTVGGVTTVTWTGLAGEADIAPGGSFSVLLDGTVASGDKASTLSNTATTSASDAPPVSATDIDTVLSPAILSILKEVETEHPNGSPTGTFVTTPPSQNMVIGHPVTFELEVTNNGDSAPLGDTIVTDNLGSDGFTFDTSEGPGTVTDGGGILTWTIPSSALGSGETATLMVTANMTGFSAGNGADVLSQTNPTSIAAVQAAWSQASTGLNHIEGYFLNSTIPFETASGALSLPLSTTYGFQVNYDERGEGDFGLGVLSPGETASGTSENEIEYIPAHGETPAETEGVVIDLGSTHASIESTIYVTSLTQGSADGEYGEVTLFNASGTPLNEAIVFGSTSIAPANVIAAAEALNPHLAIVYEQVTYPGGSGSEDGYFTVNALSSSNPFEYLGFSALPTSLGSDTDSYDVAGISYIPTTLANTEILGGMTSTVTITPVLPPICGNGYVNEAVQPIDHNVLFTLDESGSMAQTGPVNSSNVATGPQLFEPKIDGLISATLISALQLGQGAAQLAFQAVAFSTSATTLTNSWLDLPKAYAVISEIQASGSTNDQAGLTNSTEVLSSINSSTGFITASETQNDAIFITDGGANTGALPPVSAGWVATLNAWQTELGNTHFSSSVIGLGVSGSDFPSASGGTNVPIAGSNPPTDYTVAQELDPITTPSGSAQYVTNLNNLASIIVSSSNPTIQDNIITDTGSTFGQQGAGFINSITFNGETYTYTPGAANPITGPAGYEFTLSGGVAQLTLPDPTTVGTLVIDLSGSSVGDYTYTAPAAIEVNAPTLTVPISFMIEDSQQDLSNTGQLNLTIDYSQVFVGSLISNTNGTELLVQDVPAPAAQLNYILTPYISSINSIVDLNHGDDTLQAGTVTGTNTFTLDVSGSTATGEDLLIAGMGNDNLIGNLHPAGNNFDTFLFSRADVTTTPFNDTITNFVASTNTAANSHNSILDLSDLLTSSANAGSAAGTQELTPGSAAITAANLTPFITVTSTTNGLVVANNAGNDTTLTIKSLLPVSNSTTQVTDTITLKGVDLFTTYGLGAHGTSAQCVSEMLALHVLHAHR